MTGMTFAGRRWMIAAWVVGTALLLLLLSARSLAGQPPLAEGARVRLTVLPPATSPVIGVIRRDQAPWLGVAPSALQRIDVSAGYRTHKWSGAAIGGVLTSVAFVQLACALSNGSCDPGQDVGGFLAYAAVGAIPGALVGGAIGSRLRGTERWRVVWTRSDSTATHR